MSKVSRSFPLIRAGSISPMLRWMSENQRDVETALQAVDLSWYPWDDPNYPIPLRSAILFLRNLGRAEGPDIPHRVVGRNGIFELGLLGMLISKHSTPRTALMAAASGMHFHSTHELLSVQDRDGDCVIRDNFMVEFVDSEARHLVQQYFVAMVDSICSLTGHPHPRISSARMVPHPELGLTHLRRWMGDVLQPSVKEEIEVVIPAGIADRPFRGMIQKITQGADLDAAEPLRGDGTLASSVAAVARRMMEEGTPTIERLAAAAGMSRRTLQRRLSQEGTTFHQIVEQVRQEAARSAMGNSELSLQELSARLGYSQQSTFTRAMRRWTGHPPSHFRNTKTARD